MNVIQKDAFLIYKSIFTFLLQIRRAKYVLKRLTLLKDDFRTVGERGEGTLYYSLRHRLLWFANTIYYYLTDLVHPPIHPKHYKTNKYQVLLPQTQTMRSEMATAVDVDGMIAVHSNYMNRIKDQCLLGPKVPPTPPRQKPPHSHHTNTSSSPQSTKP